MTAPRVDADAAGEVWQLMSDLVLNNERRREVCDNTGLGFNKIRVLRRIVHQPRPMGELAALLNVDPPNLTTLIDDLQRAGLVERHAHPTDRRVMLVVDTAAGAELARRADEILDRPPVGLSDLSEVELATLSRILSQIQPN
ncbi:MAG TPA: MarR family transcriptional regulator [Acidimicrobiales bacterium]